MKNPAKMLLAGTLAGLLSGAMMLSSAGIRGAVFGFCLTLVVWIVRQSDWKPFVFLPGLFLGIVLGFFPMDYLGELGGEPLAYDYPTLINCTLAIPAFCWAYQATRWKSRIWKMLLVGFFSCLLRSLSLEQSWQALALIIYNFPIGMLPFMILWLGAMRLTDPQFKTP